MQNDGHDHSSSLKGMISFILSVMADFFSFFLLICAFVFGLLLLLDDWRGPSIRGGNLVFFNRVARTYHSSDVIVMKTPNAFQVRRMSLTMKRRRNKIDDEGLRISKSTIYERTFLSRKDADSPVKVRISIVDDRIYGVVSGKGIKSIVVSVFRVRGYPIVRTRHRIQFE